MKPNKFKYESYGWSQPFSNPVFLNCFQAKKISIWSLEINGKSFDRKMSEQFF